MKKITSIILLITTIGVAKAYPPAPHHMIEGVVRNEQGRPLIGDNIKVAILSSDGGLEISEVNHVYRPGVNYSLKIPMESKNGINYFKTGAFSQKMPYQLNVIVNGKVYIPIEIIGKFSKIGLPGETTLLDLTIGEDADGDGLPDAWERTLSSNINNVNPNDDSDGDGLSNLDEFKSGSYAFDKTDGVVLNIKDVNSKRALFNFNVISGRTYFLEASNDFKLWNSVKFKVTDSESDKLSEYFIAKKFDTLNIEIPIDSNLNTAYKFFKLKVK